MFCSFRLAEKWLLFFVEVLATALLSAYIMIE